MASISTLVENFDGPLDPAVWGTAGSPSTASGYLSLPCTPAYSSIGTVSSYDLTGSAAYLTVRGIPDAGNGTIESGFELQGGTGNKLQIFISGGVFTFRAIIGGVQTQSSTTFDPAVHSGWRIRESNGTVYFETSGDGVAWTTRHSVATGTFPLTAVTLDLFCGYYGTETAPGAAAFDNINIPTAIAPAPANYRWTFTDPVLNETWQMPVNPRQMTTPHPSKALETLGTAGIPLTRRTGRSPVEWTFNGVIRGQAMYEELRRWSNKPNFLLVRDHFQRTWEVMFIELNITEQRPSAKETWRATYQARTFLTRRVS
jgi:hypothetical protein